MTLSNDEFRLLHYCCYLFSGAIAGSEAVFGEPNLPAVLSLVNCTGLEEGLVDCPSSNDMECGQFDDADVVCQGYCNNNTHEYSLLTIFVSTVMCNSP